MNTPASYFTRYEIICERLQRLTCGAVWEIGRSPGGRPLHAVGYGTRRTVQRTANLSAALAADRPEAYFGSGPSGRTLVISAAIHGAEMESIAALQHLVSLLERGRDLDGVEWPQLLESARQLRLILVPVANPDGRARIPADDPLTWNEAETEKYRHGLDADGRPNSWMPGCFDPHPRPPGHDSFLGGYFNDAGVNPSHGVFLERSVSPEYWALADLVEAETAEAYLELHSCGAGPFLFCGGSLIPAEMAARRSHFDGMWREKMRHRRLPFPTWTTHSRRQVIGLEEALHHRCGVLPLVFEGGTGDRYRGNNIHRQIIETYLLLFEAVFQVGATEGFKP